MNEQEVKKLYQALLSKGYSVQDLGDEQRFLHKMSDAGNRKQLYDWVSSRGNFRIGDFDAYEARLAGAVPAADATGTVATGTVATGQTATQPKATQPTVTQPTVTQPTVQAQDGYVFSEAGLDSLVAEPKAAPAANATGTVAKPQQQVTVEQPTEAEVDAERKARLAEEIASTEATIADLDKQIEKIGHHNIVRYGAGFGAPMSAEESAEGKRKDQLLAARRQAQERLHTLKESRDKDKSGFWRNVWNTVTNPSTWSFGLIPIADALTISNVAKKLDSDSPLSSEEEALLQQMVMTDEARQQYGDDMGFMARAGQITGEALPFVGEFLLTGGFSGAADATTGAVTRGIAKATATDLTKKGVRSWLVKSTGTVAGDVVGATLMANTTGAAKTAADAMERHRGTIIQDENGDYHFGHYEEDEDGNPVFVDGGKTWARSIYEAEAANTLEYYTEMLGAHMEGPLGKFGSWLAEKSGANKAGAYMVKKLGLGEVSKDLSQITANGYGRAMKHVLERGGIQDYPSEVLEEEANIILNSMLVGDNSLSDLVDGRTQADIWGGMLFSVGFMQSPAVGIGGVQSIGYLKTKHQLDNADKLASSRLTDERWKPLRERIDETSNDNMTDLEAEILFDDQLHSEEKQAALDYIGRLLKFRGWNIGSTAKAKDEVENPAADATGTVAHDLDTSYMGGYNAEEAQLNDVKNGYEYQRQRLGELVDDETLAFFDDNPIGALMGMRKDPFWSDEQRQIAIDYVNAKAAYDGMIQRVRDDIDSRLELSNAMIDGRTHQADGMIHPATMKVDDRKVYVIGGNIVMNEDGTVDREQSDESIIIRDAETGKMEFADPREVLSADEAIDAAQEKQMAQDAIRQQYAQEAANKIDGVLPFNVGDSYQVVDEQGQQHTVTVVPVPVGESDGREPMQLAEGEVLVSIDGSEPIVMPREQVQQMADKANMARLQQFEQEKSARREAQSEAEREANRPVYNLNDVVTLQTDEGTVRGSIIGEANEDGMIEVYTEVPIGGKKINVFSRDELDGMVVDHNGAAQEPAADATGTVVAVEGQQGNKQVGEEMAAVEGGGAESMQQASAPPVIAEPGKPAADATGTVVEPMPMIGEGEDAEPDFMRATPARAHSYIYNEAGLTREEANQFVEANKKAADKALEKAKEKQPKMGTSLAKYRKEQAEYQQKVEAAQQVVDYWQQVKDAQRQVLAAESAERVATQSQQTERAIAEEQARQAEELRKREEQAALGTNNVAPAIREKWEAAPKVEGARNEIVLANGERVPGRYVLVESGAATPSHNARAEFAKNEGFPLDENGQSVNDRDYERDKDAQSTTRQISSVYDQRALQTPVVVSRDGVVLSGNGRTMAGELAADAGTDGAYIEYLKKYGQQFGFTPEQVEAFMATPAADATGTVTGHPRVVFVPDEAMPYTAETFAKFNAQEMKGQNKTEQAVKLGKVVSDETFGRIIRTINGYEKLGDFYADAKATKQAINELRDAGVISQAQYAEMFDGEAISAQGKEMLENMLIGKAFESNPDAVREITAYKSIRQSVIAALAEISNNIMLGKEYSLESELAQAIDLVYQARQNGYKAGDAVSGFARQGNLFQFDEGATVADYTNATVLMLADVLNDNRTTLLKKTLTLYNKAAKDSANGQLDIFSGDVRSQDDILNEVRQLLQYGTEAEQQAAIATATEERVAAAQEDGTAGRGSEVSAAVAAAESDVDTNPTDAQKEAGNYKKGHVRIDGFDITIENPKGSERSGRDASGREWRQVMNNTYGYIRGTEGVDGDHIDVFLSDNPESGEVFVVDQVRPEADASGTVVFDEHKVMYGFPDIESARKAYLSNYEEGWQGLGAITPVSKEEFKKWIESSHRKTKPFAEYSSVKTLGDTQLGEGVEATEQKRSFIDAIKDLYSKGKEYASKLYSMTFFDVAKTPVFMKALGLTGDKFTIRYGVLSRHVGKDVEHTFPVEVWEKLPDALQSPFAITRYYEDEQKQKQKGYRLYTAIQLPNGSFVVVSAEVKNAGRDIEVNAINTVFGRNALSDVHDELIYTAENITPEQQALLNGNNPHQYPAGREQGGISEDKGSEISANEQEKEGKSAGRPTSYQLIPTEYTTKGGKKLEMLLVKFDKELPKEQQRAANKLAKELRGWWSKDDGGYLMRDTESAEQLASAVLEESGETLEESAPVTLADMSAVTDEAQQEAAADATDTVVEVNEGSSTADESYGANNSLVSRDRYEELKARMRKKMGGQMNMGIDPEILAIGTEMAAFHIEAGARKFADFCKKMIDDLGDAIRPYLKAFYNGARELPEVEDAGYSDEMTPYDEVKRFDVLSVERAADATGTVASADAAGTTATVFERAEEVSKEDEIAHQAEEATEKILKIAQKGKKKQQSQEKRVSLPQEPDLFGFLGDDATNVEPTNDSSNGQHERTDAVRSAGLPADGSDLREHSGRRSEASGQEGERADQGREGSSVRTSRRPAGHVPQLTPSTPSGKPKGTRQPLERPANPKNTHNNHAERGKDYAPKVVDARIEANIKAIELMQQLIESGEQATPEQMAVLRQFSGWGGLGKAFNPDGYSGGYRPDGIPARLRALLGEEAYEQANMSRNSAYYTPAAVIDTMWDIARAMGFRGGNVLEGSAGIGNIIGLMPTDLSERSSIQAVEIDQTTGNILKLLYPDAQVQIQGFEATQVENGSVDLAITNVPFVPGLLVPKDTSGDSDLSRKFRHSIQDFCIAKNIRKLREGGIGIFITSRSTLDDSARLREWIVQEGGVDVVGAFRLNNETFGGTGATSDIIVVRKRVNGKKSPYAIDVLSTTGERAAEYDTGDTKRVKGEDVPVVKQLSMDYNAYFVEHPEMMGGEMHFGFEKGETFRPTSKALYPVKGKNQAEMLKGWSESFSDKDWEAIPAADATGTVADAVYEELGEGVKEGSMVVDGKGQLCVAQRGKAVPLSLNANKVKGHSKVECFEAYQSIKKALAELLRYQTEHEDDAGLQPLLKALNRAYDQFVKTYGHLHRNTSISFLKNDVDFPNVLALEKFSERGDVKTGKRILEFGKTDIFSRRVIEKEKEPEPKNVKDGIIASIYVHGRIDVPWITEKLNNGVATQSQHTEQEVRDEIVKSGLGFEDPVTRQMEVSYEYLSGNVREKLAQAQANNSDGRYDANIKALEAIIPMNIPAHLIDFNLGSSWIDPKLYEEYIKERTDIEVTLTSVGGTWMMRTPYFVGEQKNRAMGIVSEMLHKTIMGTQLIEAAIQNKTITVSETHKKWDGSTETVTDNEATQACANKIDEIRQDFRDWARAKMQSDPSLSDQIERTYNEMFNNYVPRTIPDEFVPAHFGGAATVIDGEPFSLRPHQAKAVVRATMQPLLLAHEVGSGKTYTLISTAMEMRRLGTARKPMIVVQNSTVGQFVESAKELYPGAKVLTLEDKDHTGDGRRNFYAKIKYNDWDMIIVPQSVFERIPDSEERQMAFVQDKIEEKLMALELMRDADPNSLVVKQAEREIEKLEGELADLSGAISDKRKERDAKKEAVTRQNAEVRAREMLDRETDDVENFDDMGIDAILVDEAHEYKHLGFATAMQRGVKGVDPSYSKKAQGVYLKTQAVLEKNNGRNVVFATGTPISNTAAEIWTFMRYLMPADVMKEYGIFYFDDFVRNFGNLQQMLEFTTSGKFKENNRFAGYVNLPELVRIWSSVADTVLTREVEEQRIKEGGETKIPDLEGGKAQDIYLPQTRALRSVMKYVKKQLEDYEKMSGKEKKENSHIPLTMYGIAKAAAVDARLVVSDADDEPQSKTNEAVRQTLKSLEETASYHGTVALFADNYQNKQSGFNLYEDIRAKLIAAGVPAEQIVVMKSGMSVKKKLEIFDKVNRGEVRVIMGSTFTLGTGVNIQERLHTLIHLDAPNRPMDYTQRNGRILRQGNIHKEMGKPVRVLRFGVEDSLDVTAYQRLKTKGAIADSIMNGKQMMANSMENRALEEEEDVFGDTVAQLSGSEYAMLKNQAEKDVRKYEAKKKQWEADQTYCHHEIPRLESEIRMWQERLEQYRKNLEMVVAITSQQTGLSISIGEQRFASIEGMADYIKDFNKRIKDAEIELRENPSVKSQRRQLTLTVNGIEFVITTELSIETKQEQGTLFSAVHRKMTYDCEVLNLHNVSVRQSLLREALEDIVGNVISGDDFREGIERSEGIIAKDEKSLAQVRDRSGKAFEYADELAQAHARFEEYSEAMKKELEEKEQKYREMDSDVTEATEITEATEDDEEEDDDEDVRFRDDDSGEDLLYRIREDVPPQHTGIGYKVFVLKDGKLYPPMVANPNGAPTPTGVWLDADAAPISGMSKTGRAQVKAGGKGTQGGSGTLAYRPGWHLGTIPYALQFNRKNPETGEKELFPANFVWAEVEYANDVDYQDAANNAGVNANGKYQHSLAGLKRVPVNGSYMYRTNPNPETDPWIITGAMKVKRILKPSEVDAMVKAAGREPQQRQDGYVSDAEIDALNEEIEVRDREGDNTERMTEDESLASSRRAGFTKKQHEAFVERQKRRMRDGARELISRLKLDGRVTLKEDASGLKGRKARAKGWFDAKTGKIVIVLSNHSGLNDVLKTILHEGVAHYGLRKLFGSRFDQFLDNVFQHAETDIRAQIVEMARARDWDFREATEEYLARLAEDTDFERADGTGWWSKIKSWFLNMLRELGLPSYGGSALSDNELRYILWRSYENLAEPGRYRNPFREAEDISKQMELGVGSFEAAASPVDEQLDRDRRIARVIVAFKKKYPDESTMALILSGDKYYSTDRKELEDIIGQTSIPKNKLDLFLPRLIRAGMRVAVIDENSPFMEAAEQGGERFRDGDFSERDRATARDAYERMVSSGMYQFREAVQDSMLGLEKLYEAILNPTLTHRAQLRIEDVEGYENAYLAENRMSSVNAAEQHDYYLRFMLPLLEEIGRLTKPAANATGTVATARQMLTDYMMAKHGLERNRVFAERDAREVEANGGDFNDAYQKFREKDYSGLTALTGEDDVAAAEAAAQQIVDDYEAAYDTTELWSRTREATQATLEKIYRSGLLSKERYEQIRDMFEYYIPLQGWDETTSDEVYGYLTSKSGPFGSPIKHAVGRSSKADDPIATIAMMADSAIRQGNRNQMKQRFLNFVQNHPSDLVSINSLWLEYDAASDSWVPVFADLEDGDTAADVERKVEAFEQRMEQLAAADPDRYKHGRDARNIPYKVVRGNLKEHQVLVKRGGETFVLTINGSPRAAQALNGLTNPDVETGGVVGNMLKAGEWVNRHLSAFYTTRNPDFVVSNFFRDMLYSNCMTWVKESPRYALRFHKNFGKMNPAIMRKLLGEWESGELRGKVATQSQQTRQGSMDYYRKLFYQFMMNGGETGYTSVRDIEEHKKEIANELKKQGSMTRKAWSALGMQLDLLNRSVENCARFAAFVTSREMGRSIDRSIYDAKEVSVNFNKKGSGGKMVNATGQTFLGKVGSYVGGGGRLAYVFWNAGVQGLTNFGRAGKRHKGKAIAGAAAMFILGYVIPQLAAMMGGGDGDDDDKNAYYNLPEYVRRSNICFRVGEQWVTMPLPIEFRAIYGLGELASGVISGNEYYDNKEMAYQFASQLSQILPLDMLEGGGGVSPIIPSLAKPFVEAYIMNRSWTGLPIYKDTPYNQNDPEWTKAYKNADQTLVGVSKWLNEATGGDEFKKGAIDINPAKVEYLLNGVFGGYMNTAEKLKKMGETVLGDRDFDWRNMLLANRVIKSGDERTANRKLQNEYFKYKKEYEETRRLLRKYDAAADEGVSGMAEKVDFLYNSPEYMRYELFDEYKADIDDMRDDMTDAADESERKNIEAEMYATMRELIDQLHEVK